MVVRASPQHSAHTENVTSHDQLPQVLTRIVERTAQIVEALTDLDEAGLTAPSELPVEGAWLLVASDGPTYRVSVCEALVRVEATP